MYIIIFYLLIINFIGLLIMYTDKQRAIKNKYRIAESTLWLIAVIGGAIGTTIGMNLFRHKTKHFTFKFGFPLIMLLQIGALIYLADKHM